LDDQLDGGGFANFQRTFPLTTVVALTAPQTHLGWEFVGWNYDEDGFTPSQKGGFGLQATGRTIEIIILDEFSLKAIYRPGVYLP
jgi:hypothetical protein